MPQIFVATPVGQKAVDVELTDTIAEVKQKALAKLPPTDKIAVLRFKGKFLDDARTLADYGVQEENTLEMGLAPRAVGAAVAAAAAGSGAAQIHRPPPVNEMATLALGRRIEAISEQRGRFLFVSIGSYIHGKKVDAEVERQQCPPAVLAYCQANGLELDILLVDQSFGSAIDDSDTAAAAGPGNPQIYNIEKGWVPRETLWGGIVRHYNHPSTRCVLSVYGTSVTDDEWKPGASTLAGVNLAAIAQKLSGNGGFMHVQSFNGDVIASNWKG